MSSPLTSVAPVPNLAPLSVAERGSPGRSNPTDPNSCPTRSGHATVSATEDPNPWTRAHPQLRGAGLGPEDIEMESVTPSGHRRRRSSLVNPANAASNHHRSSRARSQSIRHAASGDEAKIVEESSDEGPLRLGESDEDGATDEDLHDDEETGLTVKDRRRKRRKRNRNQLLDQRIARDNISQEEKQEADRNVARRLLINAVLIGLWYFFSLLISLVWTRLPLCISCWYSVC